LVQEAKAHNVLYSQLLCVSSLFRKSSKIYCLFYIILFQVFCIFFFLIRNHSLSTQPMTTVQFSIDFNGKFHSIIYKNVKLPLLLSSEVHQWSTTWSWIPHILNFTDSRRWVVSFTLQPFYSKAESSQYTLDIGGWVSSTTSLNLVLKGTIPAPTGNWTLVTHFTACHFNEPSEFLTYYS
jgi:hypothetical protein